MSMGRTILHLSAVLTACVLAFALGFLSAETLQVVQGRLERQAALQLARQPATEVARIRLEARPYRERLEAIGTIQPWRSARLAFAEAGGVREVMAEVGDRVLGPGEGRQGQPLARLDLDRFQARADAAAADLAKAQWDRAQLEPLFRQGQASQEEWRRTGLLVDLKAAERVRAEKSLADAVLRAPFTGVVAERLVEIGEAASPAAPAFRLIETTRVKVVIRVPGSRIDEIRPGQDAELRVELSKGRLEHLRGTVHKLLPSGEGRLFPVEIEVENPDGRLREGLLARVIVFTGTNPRLFVLPLETVIERGARRLVMLFMEQDRIVTGRYDLGKLADPARKRVSQQLGLEAAPGRWISVSEARWDALDLSARERILARTEMTRGELPDWLGVAVFRIGAIARERDLPGARIEGDLCLVPDDGSLREGEFLIVRGQQRLSDGAEVILADRNELPIPGVDPSAGESR